MKKPTLYLIIFIGAATVALNSLFTSCQGGTTDGESSPQPLLPDRYPHATYYQGQYYFTSQPSADTIYLTAASSLEGLADAQPHAAWSPDSAGQFYHIWSPELHRLQDAWYIYFEADDGNMDNHHLYVLENTAANPLQGSWHMKGVLHTNDEWNYGLHPTILRTPDNTYLLWSGWPKRRTEIETQCIYIARMDNPWTVGSERVMLSRPEYEWELQWINPNGNRLAYPIYVNENPEAFLTPDGRHACVCYSASGIWTIYHVLGMLTAPTTADLLDPTSWTKSPEPLFTSAYQPSDETDLANALYGTSNICLITDAATSRLITTDDGLQTPLLYEGMWYSDDTEHRATFLGTVHWTTNGLPDFGTPASAE